MAITELSSFPPVLHDNLNKPGLRYRNIEDKVTQIVSTHISNVLTVEINPKVNRLRAIRLTYGLVGVSIAGAAICMSAISLIAGYKKLDYLIATFCVGSLSIASFIVQLIAYKIYNNLFNYKQTECQRRVDQWKTNHLDELVTDLTNYLSNLTAIECNLLNDHQLLQDYPQNLPTLRVLNKNGILNEYQRKVVDWITLYRKKKYHQPSQANKLSTYVIENLNFEETAAKYPAILIAMKKDHPNEPLLRTRMQVLKSRFNQNDHSLDCIPPPSDDEEQEELVAETSGQSSSVCSSIDITKENVLEILSFYGKQGTNPTAERCILFLAGIVDQGDYPTISKVPYYYQNLMGDEFRETLLPNIINKFQELYEKTDDKRMLLLSISYFCGKFGLKRSTQRSVWNLPDPSIPKGVLWDDYHCYTSLLVILNEISASKQITLLLKDGSTIDQVERAMLIKASPYFERVIGINRDNTIQVDENNASTFNFFIENISNDFNLIDVENFQSVFELSSKYMIDRGIVKCASFFAKNLTKMDLSLISGKNFYLPDWTGESDWDEISTMIRELTSTLVGSKHPVSLNAKIRQFFNCFGIKTGYAAFFMHLKQQLPDKIEKKLTPLFHCRAFTSLLSLLSIFNESEPLRNQLETRIYEGLHTALKNHLKTLWENAYNRKDIPLQMAIVDFCNTPEGANAIQNVDEWLAIPNELHQLMNSNQPTKV